jgi:hypothetical protein
MYIYNILHTGGVNYFSTRYDSFLVRYPDILNDSKRSAMSSSPTEHTCDA